MYSARLFGIPELFYQEENISAYIKRQQARRLLYYLIANRKTVSYRNACQIIYGENHCDSSALQKLRVLISQLRSSLPDASLILSTPDGYAINQKIIRVDYWEYLDAWENARHYFSRQQPTYSWNAYQALKRGIEAWGNATVLLAEQDDGPDSWQNWLESIRLETNAHCEDFADWVKKYYQANPAPEMLAWLHRAAQHFPYNEALQETFLQAAQKHHRPMLVRQHLRELEKLYGELPSGFSKYLLPRQNSQRGMPIKTSPPAFPLREKEQRELLQTFQRGGKVWISGPDGSGKTTLLKNFEKNIKKQFPDDYRLLRVTGVESLRQVPYGAIYHAISRHRQELQAILDETAENWRFLRNFLSDSVTPTTIPHGKPLENELLQLVQLLSQRPMFILEIEDAHQLDRQSLQVLQALLQHAYFDAPHHLLILTTDEPLQNQFLQEILTSPNRRFRFQKQISLPPLSREEARKLANYLLGASPADSLLDDILEYSQGILREFIQIIHNLQTLFPLESILELQELPIPQIDIGLLPLAARLEMLPDSQRELLYLLAALNRPVALKELWQIVPQTNTLPDDLDALQETGWLENRGDSYKLLNERSLQAIFHALPAHRKAEYHLKIAERLSKNAHTPHEAAFLAGHWEQAHRPEQALRYYLQAARYNFDWASALEAFQIIEKASPLLRINVSNLAWRPIYHFYTLLNEIAFGLDDPALLRRHAAELQFIASQRTHRISEQNLLQATAHNLLSNAAMAENRFGEYENHAKQAQEILQAIPPATPDLEAAYIAELSAALLNQGVALYMQGKFQQAYGLFQRSISLCEQPQEEAHSLAPEVEFIRRILVQNHVHALYQLGLAEMFRGDIAAAHQNALQGLQKAQQIAWGYGQIIHCSLLSGILFMFGDFQQAYEYAEKGLQLAEPRHIRRMTGYLHGYRAMAALELGDVKTAWEDTTTCIEIGRQYHHDEIVAFAYRTRGDLFLHLHSPALAARQYQHGQQASPQGFMGLDCAYRTLICNALQGKATPETQRAQAALESGFAQNGLEAVIAHGRILYLLGLARNGELEKFSEEWEHLQTMFAKAEFPVSLQGWYEWLQGKPASPEQLLAPASIWLALQRAVHQYQRHPKERYRENIRSLVEQIRLPEDETVQQAWQGYWQPLLTTL
jgi:DNA-binding SARP family transcriptional activator